ncbi:MAG: DUF4276 family protein [Desulfovibrio sp.]|nr:DUF4276 family protein [Desulfovibrio sp.]
MSTLVFLLEEESARELLQVIVQKLLPPEMTVRYMNFEGKQDLEQEIVRKLRGWRTPDTAFIILRDQDAGNCKQIKQRLLDLVHESGKKENCLVRIACHELENFYLGDLAAVAEGLNVPDLGKLQRKTPYRSPDDIANASEQLKKITNKKYRKIAGSRAIARFMKLDGSNLSNSFRVLCSGIQKLGR